MERINTRTSSTLQENESPALEAASSRANNESGEQRAGNVHNVDEIFDWGEKLRLESLRELREDPTLAKTVDLIFHNARQYCKMIDPETGNLLHPAEGNGYYPDAMERPDIKKILRMQVVEAAKKMMGDRGVTSASMEEVLASPEGRQLESLVNVVFNEKGLSESPNTKLPSHAGEYKNYDGSKEDMDYYARTATELGLSTERGANVMALGHGATSIAVRAA